MILLIKKSIFPKYKILPYNQIKSNKLKKSTKKIDRSHLDHPQILKIKKILIENKLDE